MPCRGGDFRGGQGPTRASFESSEEAGLWLRWEPEGRVVLCRDETKEEESLRGRS